MTATDNFYALNTPYTKGSKILELFYGNGCKFEPAVKPLSSTLGACLINNKGQIIIDFEDSDEAYKWVQSLGIIFQPFLENYLTK